MRRLVASLAFIPSLLTMPVAAHAQLTVARIFGGSDFSGSSLGPVRWMRDGRSVLEIGAGGSSLLQVDLVTGTATMLADSATLTTPDGQHLRVEGAVLSPDERKVLLFHSTVQVWRSNTRGIYHVLDLDSRRLQPLVSGPPIPVAPRSNAPGFSAPPLSWAAPDPRLQMFASFSPDSRQVAFVMGNNVWVTDLASSKSWPLTQDGSADIINGTTDWVYEEELGLRDAIRWSPDGSRIAYWQFDQHEVPAFPLVDELRPYPTVASLRYPMAGAPNSRVRIGVVASSGGATSWLDTGPDTGVYLARMEWVGRDSLAITRLPRRQNRTDVLMLSATSGTGRTMEVDRDSAYVNVGLPDVQGRGIRWIGNGSEFLWASDRSGWRQVYLHRRDGTIVRQVTTDGADVLDLVAVDEGGDFVYVTEAAPDPTQRQVYRFPLHGRKKGTAGGVRLLSVSGTHRLDVGPTGRWAIDLYSALGRPPTRILYEFPSMRRSRIIDDNAPLVAALDSLQLQRPGFIRVPIAAGIELDGYRIVPPGFDSTRKYPVLMYAYGGPASPQVTDAWGGQRYLWHQLLAQRGIVVVVVDNRGAAWRGRDFRKVTQYRLGLIESDDQIAVARWLGRQSWADASRIGLWGWSYGGFLTSITLTRGGNIFRMGMAVAPVTDWRLYDSIYTERYMWTPQANASGYQESSPQLRARDLTARLLLVHGTGDDNVHPQNTLQFAERLVEAGRPFSMMLYPNRTHAITGANASVHLFETLTAFVLANL